MVSNGEATLGSCDLATGLRYGLYQPCLDIKTAGLWNCVPGAISRPLKNNNNGRLKIPLSHIARQYSS